MDLMNLVAYLSLDTSAYEGKLGGLAKGIGGMMKTVGIAVGAASAVVGKFGLDAVQTGMEFDKSMSQVAATMGKTVDEIQDLRDFAQEMGRTTVFSATQSADALNYMALAGYDAETSMSMLPNVLNLAAAGGLELARASDMITDTQTALGLSLDETRVLVDQMAKASSTGNTSVGQLGDALLAVGATARGLDMTNVNAVLTSLADNGIKGAEAGTHLRNILLTIDGKKFEKTFGALGVSARDADGNMRNLTDVLKDMNTVLEGMENDGERANLINNTFNRADLASINALLGVTEDRWNTLTEAIDNAEGAAGKMAETQLDNLAGDVTLLKSAFEGLQISISDSASPALRSGIQMITGSIEELTNAISSGDFGAFGDALSNAFMNVGKYVVSALPQIAQVGAQMIKTLSKSIIGAMPELVSAAGEIIGIIVSTTMELAPELLTLGAELLNSMSQGMAEGMPTMLENFLPKLLEFSQSLLDNAGSFVDAGINFIMSLVDGLINGLPLLIEYVPQIITNIANIINENAPKLLEAGFQLIIKLGMGLIQAIPAIIANLGNIVQAMIAVFRAINWLNLGSEIITFISSGIKTLATNIPTALKNIATSGWNAFKNIDWSGVGRAVIDGIAAGLRAAGHIITDFLLGLANNALDSIKSFFGIKSPSRVMRDQVGKQIALGMAEGIERNAKYVMDAMTNLEDIANVGVNTTNVGVNGEGGYGSYNQTVNIYSPTELNPSEVARQTRNANRDAVLALRGL